MAIRELRKQIEQNKQRLEGLILASKNEVFPDLFQVLWQDGEGKKYTRLMTNNEIIVFNKKSSSDKFAEPNNPSFW